MVFRCLVDDYPLGIPLPWPWLLVAGAQEGTGHTHPASCQVGFAGLLLLARLLLFCWLPLGNLPDTCKSGELISSTLFDVSIRVWLLSGLVSAYLSCRAAVRCGAACCLSLPVIGFDSLGSLHVFTFVCFLLWKVFLRHSKGWSRTITHRTPNISTKFSINHQYSVLAVSTVNFFSLSNH